MTSITETELRASIKEILKHADLTTMSAKKVRIQLEEKHKIQLTERKKEIDQVVMELITNGIDNDSEQEDSKNFEQINSKNIKQEDTKDIKQEGEKNIKLEDEKNSEEEDSKKNIKSESRLSDPSEDDDDDDESLDEPSPKKIKTSKKSDKHVNDEQVAKQLQNEEEETSFRRRSRAVKKPPKPQKEKKKKEKSETKGKYGKPCLLSPELADIMGTEKMHRSDIVKRMWEIIRERNLQDPKNKQFMLCDEQLLKVFGKKRVRTFGMMKNLKYHIKDEFLVST